jgi:hypothetical protein
LAGGRLDCKLDRKKRDWPVVWKGYDKGKKITDLTNVLERINI